MPQPMGAEAGLVARLVALLAPSLVLRRLAMSGCALAPESFPALAPLPRCLQAAQLVRKPPPPAPVPHYTPCSPLPPPPPPPEKALGFSETQRSTSLLWPAARMAS